jgi:hypothetical protein
MATAQVFTHHLIDTTRSVLLGVGLAYAIEEKLYSHLPLTFLFPATYAGYQIYSNRAKILSWTHAQRSPLSREGSKTD